GRAIALRADMDALELAEETGLPYASETPGRMHACGHDGHMTCLLGAAQVLSAHRERLAGSVKFIFQPGEELGAGGRLIAQEGVLDDVDAVFGLHAWPGIPVGCVGVKDGPMMAGADWFRIEIQGRGCHGADPAAGVDPVVVAAHITTALQTIVSREVDPIEPAVLTIGRIHGGVTTNIIPDTAEMMGTFRTLTGEVRDLMAGAIERVAARTAEAFRASAVISFGDDSYIPLHNDPEMTNFVRDTVRSALGNAALVEITKPSMASEDFAFYLEKAPGSYLRLGTGASEEGNCAPLHSPRFDFNDAAISTGVSVFVSLAGRFLG
ncbi:MAG: amidohydrolase, partial [Nitrospiraceae bacterium]|nr:amidohydrolase [Nitrospiraceae bacterium]